MYQHDLNLITEQGHSDTPEEIGYTK